MDNFEFDTALTELAKIGSSTPARLTCRYLGCASFPTHLALRTQRSGRFRSVRLRAIFAEPDSVRMESVRIQILAGIALLVPGRFRSPPPCPGHLPFRPAILSLAGLTALYVRFGQSTLYTERLDPRLSLGPGMRFKECAELMGLPNLQESPAGNSRSAHLDARVALHSHLTSVADLLTLAADDEHGSVEAIHQLRVQTRRSQAAIAAYQACLPKRHAKWFRKRLRQIRQASNDARDLDVFLIRFQHKQSAKFQKLLRWVRRRRRKAQQPIVASHHKWISSGRFALRTEMLLRSIDVGDSYSPSELALPRLARLAADCLGAAPTAGASVKNFHRFRVRVKSLRYAIDLFESALDPDYRSRFVRYLSKLQKQLGMLNDHAAAVTRLQGWHNKMNDKSMRRHIQKLIESEQRSVILAIQRFDAKRIDKAIARLREFATDCEARSICENRQNPVERSVPF